MRGTIVILLCGTVVLSPGPSRALAAQPPASTTSVGQQLEAIPVYARVSVRLVGGRTIDGYLVAKSEDGVTIRPSRGEGTLQEVPLSAIASIQLKAEGRGLSRGQKIAIATAVGAAVVVIAWIWAVKSRAFGA